MRTEIAGIRGALAALILLGVASVPTATAEEVPTVPGAAERLAEAIRFQTISWEEEGRLDRETFLAFHVFLERSFPRVHASLRREIVKEYSLLYTWTGKDPSRNRFC